MARPSTVPSASKTTYLPPPDSAAIAAAKPRGRPGRNSPRHHAAMVPGVCALAASAARSAGTGGTAATKRAATWIAISAKTASGTAASRRVRIEIPRRRDTAAAVLLRTLEQPAVHRLAEHVALHR